MNKAGEELVGVGYEADLRRHSFYAFFAALLFFVTFSGAMLTRELALRDALAETNRRLDEAILDVVAREFELVERITVLECRGGIRGDC